MSHLLLLCSEAFSSLFDQSREFLLAQWSESFFFRNITVVFYWLCNIFPSVGKVKNNDAHVLWLLAGQVSFDLFSEGVSRCCCSLLCFL